MPSLYAVLATATFLVSSAQAQAQYTIDPTSVTLATRDNWCQQEKSTCPLICEQVPPGGFQVNDCDPMALTYGCVCENGMSPNLSEYSLTLPFFICQEWGNQCVANCGADSSCASDCRQNHPCGALDPQRVNTTSSTSIATPTQSGAAATSSAGQVYNGLGGDGGDNSGSNNPDGSSGTKPSGASPLLQYGSLVGSLALAGCVTLGSLLL